MQLHYPCTLRMRDMLPGRLLRKAPGTFSEHYLAQCMQDFAGTRAQFKGKLPQRARWG